MAAVALDELPQLPDDGRRYEVVDGSLVVRPPPSQLHQLVGAELFRQLLSQCPLCWRVETDPGLLLVAHRLAGASYEQVAVLDPAGTAPVPWGGAHVDLAQVPRPRS